ncbi:MAG: methanogenesis marker 6 protein [Candidatus Bathyarchaeota archaeon]|nr:methanogenesis marker 6 protein [Candidatus Bathyarchaeota archaeon]
MVVLSSDSMLTPKHLIYKVATFTLPITVKETCYGMLIEGKKDDVENAVNEVRKLDPEKIFVKLRGFPIGDRRVCRSSRGGGSRLGFQQLEAEYKLLPLISQGLKNMFTCEETLEKEEKLLPITKLKKIIEEEA